MRKAGFTTKQTRYFLWSFFFLNLFDVITTKLCVDKYGIFGSFYEANPFVLDQSGNFDVFFLMFKLFLVPAIVSLLVLYANKKYLIRILCYKDGSDVFTKYFKKKRILDKTVIFLNLFMFFVVLQNLSIYLWEIPIFATFKGFIVVNSIIYLTFLVFF